MSTFLSETYDKPKLVENKIVKKILNEQSNDITIQTKIKHFLIEFIKKHYKIIIGIIILFIGLYWRYRETNKKKQQIQKQDSESEYSNSEYSESEYSNN